MAYQDIGRINFMCPDCRAQWTNEYEEAYFDPQTGLKSWSAPCEVHEVHGTGCQFGEEIHGQK